MNRLRSLAAALSLLLLGGAPAALAETDTTNTFVVVRIFASAALARPLHEIGYLFEREHPGVQLDYESSASGMIVNGVLQGVPPDLFVSAGEKYQEEILAAGKANLYETIARDRLAIATQCRTPPYGYKLPVFPQVITDQNLIDKLMDPDTHLSIASPTLSVAGQMGVKWFEAIDKQRPGALKAIMRHAKVEMDTEWVARALVEHKTNIGILYASQIEGLRRQGECIDQLEIPKAYGLPEVVFTVSSVLSGTGHSMSAEGQKLNDEIQSLYRSKRGQDIFVKWGLKPAK
jgi:ABC-type molybdate transport system substrate-binding protein